MTLLPEIYILSFSVLFLFLSLGKGKKLLFPLARALSLGAVAVCLFSLNSEGLFFAGAYQSSAFFTNSQECGIQLLFSFDATSEVTAQIDSSDTLAFDGS